MRVCARRGTLTDEAHGLVVLDPLDSVLKPFGRVSPLVVALLVFVFSACSSKPTSASGVGGSSPAVQSVLLVLKTYEEACAYEGSICLPGTAGVIPAALKR